MRRALNECKGFCMPSMSHHACRTSVSQPARGHGRAHTQRGVRNEAGANARAHPPTSQTPSLVRQQAEPARAGALRALPSQWRQTCPLRPCPQCRRREWRCLHPTPPQGPARREASPRRAVCLTVAAASAGALACAQSGGLSAPLQRTLRFARCACSVAASRGLWG